MGREVHEYDKAKLPEGALFPKDQIIQTIKLANKLGARIPYEVAEQLIKSNQEIQQQLQKIPTSISILDDDERIPWDALKPLFDIFRIKHLSITGLTKILYKKLPNLIPILDKVIMQGYLKPILVRQGTAVARGETERAITYIKEFNKYVDKNKEALIKLQIYCKEKWYDISIIRSVRHSTVVMSRPLQREAM